MAGLSVAYAHLRQPPHPHNKSSLSLQYIMANIVVPILEHSNKDKPSHNRFTSTMDL